MNSEQKVHPGSIVHLLLQTVVKMTPSEKIFHSIYVHVALVSAL